MVFQKHTASTLTKLFLKMSLWHYRVIRSSKAEAEKTEKFLRCINMWDKKKDSYPGMLSGGQKQRIANARWSCHES